MFRKALPAVSWLGLGLLFGAVVAPTGRPAAARRLDRAAFHEALSQVLDRYVDPMDETAVLHRALSAAVSGLDSYSYFVEPELRRRLQAGMGPVDYGLFLRWHPRRPGLWVDHVVSGSAADRAGLHPGDRIVQVDDLPLDGSVNRAQALSALHGLPGSRATLHVVRNGGRRTLELTRTGQRADTVTARLAHLPRSRGGGPVAVVAVSAFYPGTAEEIRRALDRLRARAGAPLSGIVLDLRGNPGGRVSEALRVADAFVARGVLAHLRGRGGRLLRRERAHGPGTDTATPLAVVLDERSASAAELLAAALSDHGRAVVVGRRSHGKGSVQEVVGLPDGSAMVLTVARYTGPRDRPIDGEGLAPDVPVTESTDPIPVALAHLAGAREPAETATPPS